MNQFKVSFLAFFLFFNFIFIFSADRYVRAGGGNYSAAGTWEITPGGGEVCAVPTAADDVYLVVGSGNLTIDAASVCRSINCTGYTGTITHNAAVTLSIGDGTAGAGNIALKFVSTMTYTLGDNRTSLLKFVSTSATVQTVDWGSKTTGSVTFEGASGSWQYSSDHTLTTTSTLSLNLGTLDTNSKTINSAEFSTNVVGTRVLTLGSTVMNLTGVNVTGSFRHFRAGQATGLTVTANTAIVNLFKKTGLDTIFVTDVIDWNGLSIVFNGGALANMGGAAGTVKNITVNGAAYVDVADDSFMLNANLTITGTLTLNGYSTSRRLKVISNSGGTQRTITVPNGTSVTGKNLSFKDISLSVSNDLSAIVGGAVNAGNNNNIVFTTFVPGRFWVGGGSSNTWAATVPTNWADETGAINATVPTSSTDVFFDGNSGTGNSVIGASITIRSLNTNGYTGTLTHNSSVNLSIGDGTAGTGNIALQFGTGMTYTLGNGASSAIIFISTSATVQTIDWGGKTTGNVTFNATSNGSWKYLSNHTFSTIAILDLTKGTLDTNGKTLSGAFITSDNGNVRTLTLGSSVINLYGKDIPGLMFQYASFDNLANLTVSPNTATINIHRNAGANAYCYMGFQTKDWNGLEINFLGGGWGVLGGGSGSTFRNLTYTGAANSNNVEDVMRVREAIVVSNSIVLNGYSATRRMKMHIDGVKTINVNTATVSGQYVDFYDTNFSALKDLSAITGGSGDAKSNSNITFTPSITCYWKTTTGGTKQWSDVNNWYLGTNGTGGQARIPLPQDDVIFDSNSIGAASTIVNVNSDVLRVGRNIDWTGVQNNPVWHLEPIANTSGIVFGSSVSNFGSLTLDPNMTMTSSKPNASFNMLGSGTGQAFTLKTCGVLIPQEEFLIYMAPTNTLTLLDSFNGNATNTTLLKTSSNYNYHSGDVVGTVNFNNFNVTTGRFLQETTGIINMGSGTTKLTGTGTVWSCAGTINPDTSTIELNNNTTNPQTFAGSNKTYNNITITGTANSNYTFSGNNTFNNFTDSKAVAHTLFFTTGSTTTFTGTITLNGSAGNFITLTSTTTTPFIWTKAAGATTCDYLILSKSTANTSGTATFTAGANTYNGGSNSAGNAGWAGLTNQNFTWTGATNNNWSNSGNWQGGAVPGVNDYAVFTGIFNVNCTIDAGCNCKGIIVGLAYTGTITQASAMIIGTGGIEINGGTFTGATQTITNSGYFKQTGGTFQNTSGTHEVTAMGSLIDTWFVSAGTHTANSGTVKISGSQAAIVTNSSGRQFYHLELNTTGTVSGTFFVDGDLTRTQGNTLDADISVKLDYKGAGGTTAGTGIIRFTGAGAQNFTNPSAPSVQVNKGGGALVVPANLSVGGSWTHSAGTITWNNRRVTFDNVNAAGITITTGTFYDVEIAKNSLYDVTLSGITTISNQLTITSLKNLDSVLTIPGITSNIELSGNYIITSTTWGGTSKIVFKGSGSNTISGLGKQGVSADVYKTGGSLQLSTNLDIPNTGHDLVVRSGHLNLSTYNLSVNDQLTVYGTMTLSGLSSQVITVSGTTAISSSGNFTLSATSSTVIYSDGAGTAVVTNLKKNFYNLTLGASKTHEFATGAPNATTINGRFASNGTSGTRSILRSLSDVATDWKLTLNGTSTLSNKVNVKRSDASGGLGVLAVGSINSGNNTNWVGLVTPPTITSITSSTANGTYTTGANISIRINFSETVTLTGTLGINLDSGGVCVINAFTATTATGTYTVGSGQNSSDLTASSVVVSGTVQNASLVDLVTTLPSTNIATGSNIVIDTTAPTVTSVNSSTSNGSYKVGSSISVTVNFSESVTVTGTPTLLLETGATDRTINYVSGSGSSALVFSYTVQTGDTSSDLDYNATNSLSGTIKDSALNNATLTLASPGAANSLGANKAIIIDTTAPSITSITSSTANGSYKSGSAISIRINFSENITLTGTMGINLDSGGVCVISAFTGTTTTGTYTVASGQTSSDLTASSVVVNTTARDAALNDLSTTLPGTNIATGSNIVIDTTAPTITSITSSTTNGTYGVGANISIRINFSENITLTGTMGINLDSGGVCVISAFTGTTATGTYTVGSSQTSADLTASSVTVNSTARDAALNNLTTTLPSTNIATGSNIVIDTTAPTITTKALGSSNAYIDITFSEAVYTTNTTSGGLLIADFNLAFAANGGTATAVSITGVTKTTGAATSGGETTVRLTLSVTGSVSGTETITITPVAASIFDAAGNAASTSTTTGAVTLQANLPPAVTQVTSSTTNGTYKAGDTVSIQVVFDAAVTVTGTPQLTLETGSTDRTIDYVSGSGSTSLTFTYTVQSGDTSSDLDYTATTALSLNSGTIKSAASINATLVLPTPGTSNSLGSNKALVIDTTAPTVTSVSSTTSDGSYGLASVITISVIFSEAVTVTGVPTLALETGFVDQTASYSSGSGTTTLLFTYTVQSADTSSDLDYSSTTALALSSGTIKDAAGNSATLTLATPGATNSLSSNKAIVIDTTSPIVMTVGSSTADGAYKAGSIISITVTFTEAVVVTGSPTLTLETGTTDRNATYNSGSGSNILVFTYTVQSGDSSSDLDYTSTSALALSSGTIKDAAGNAATLTLAVPGATNSLGSANNIVVDTTSPSITDKALSSGATYVDITFSEPVYTSAGSGALTSADFTVTFVKNGGTATGVAISSLVNTSGVALSGGETVIRAMLTISGAIAGVETFSISPKSNEIFDLAGNASTTTGTGSIAIVDTLSPTVLSVDTTNADGAYKAGSTIVITVTFSEAVTVSGTPSLTLETGLTDAVATYVSGSDTDTLTFAYTVQSGEKSSDLDYKASTALVTNGGSIVDAASNVATLTLVTPGDAGSLNSNADIEIDTTLPTVKKAEMSSNNDYVDITFSEPVFTQAGTGALIPSNFILVTQANAGTSISVTVTSILTTDETALVGGETKVRMHISITGTTKGNEKIVIQTLADTVFDKAGNAMLPLNETVNIKTQTVVGGGSSAGGCQYTPNSSTSSLIDYIFLIIMANIFKFVKSISGTKSNKKDC